MKKLILLSLFLFWLAALCDAGGSTNSDGNTDGNSEGSHGDDHGEGNHSAALFGTMGEISSLQGSLAILIIVLAVLLVEKVFHSLHAITHDTPFQDMVSAIEKELMIVGCMAFAF